MATLREIRTRIASVKSTQQITKAMKMVAAAKLRRAQESIMATRPYASKLQDIVTHLISRSENGEHPFIEDRPVSKVLLVVVTSDRGLCGGFNANLFREATNILEREQDVEYELFVIGKKGYEHFARRDYSISDHKINFFNQLDFQDAVDIVSRIVPVYREGHYDRIEILYNEFKSAVKQDIALEQVLPLVKQTDEETKTQMDYLYEPGREEILETIIPKQINIQVWKVLLESNASEQGARMTAMESATDNAEELIDTLTLHYNRARQAAITKEISEIVGGAEALKEK
jgi:F-type H+-transporting ATPase subunit gamma